MSRKTTLKLTARDRELLASLDYSPFDARQLAALSTTFSRPFTDEKFVRRRMQALADAGLVAHFHYRTDSPGAVKYYKLTRSGYRMLAGPDKGLPRRAYFNAVSPRLQNHTRRLADLMVHTLTAAHAGGVKVLSFYGENRLELKLGSRSARLDAAAQFKIKGYRTRNALFELDAGTEPIYSDRQRESLSRKVRFVYDYEVSAPQKFRHYTVFAAPMARMASYLQMAADLNPHPQRSICYATTLDAFLAADDPLRSQIFLNDRRQRSSILPSAGQGSVALPSLELPLRQQWALV